MFPSLKSKNRFNVLREEDGQIIDRNLNNKNNFHRHYNVFFSKLWVPLHQSALGWEEVDLACGETFLFIQAAFLIQAY